MIYIVATLAIAIGFNCIVLISKFRRNRYFDATLDTLILIAVSILFSGSITGLAAGTFGSMLVSIYLWFKPVKFPSLAFWR